METVSVNTSAATNASPKLTKKPSLGDIRSLPGSEKKTYGCDHAKDILENAPQEAVKQYTRLVQTINKEAGFSTRLPKNSAVLTLKPTFLCLQCPNVATSEQRDRHDKTHRFCVESGSGAVYCRECKDYIYDSTFEEVRTQQGKKRKFSAYISDVDNKILAANAGPTPCRAAGLRGLYNMGNTCFMSVVLQSLIHNPFVRAYYLAEGHKSLDCEREACISCALDEIFNEFHSQEKAEGYGLVAMLQSSWRTGGSLAGYQQQDAHEYLQFLLNSLHSANIDPDEKEDKAEDCTCVIHKTFGGLLQSTVTCSKCKNVNSTLDPFMDLSLDVRKDPVKKKEPPSKKDKSDGTIVAAPPMNLTECFDRFTSPETLPASEYTCRNCSSAQAATKRLSLARLPPCLPIHLKRFSHSKNSATSIKLETKVKFPLSVDLAPYAVDKAKKVKPESADKDKDKDTKQKKDTEKEPPKPVYELASVIQHKGKMDSGHYISFSRVDDEWFMFDDSKVVVVEESRVLSSEAYMLFYVVKEIDV